ncbi:tetratricopeptide repeat protein [Botrimarina sp.]|uniref:tetratricopeptide repeat protein n=1 Tax=Botrimarina sp. TaxID=2795802 RepID=UPI0032F05CAD
MNPSPIPTRRKIARLAVAFAAAYAPVAALGADRIRLEGGESISGRIVDESAQAVSIEDIDGRVRKAPVERIRSVLFDGEPASLAQARLNAEAGGYETALEKLADIDVSTISDERIRDEIAFLKAYSAARLAEAGQGAEAEAVKPLLEFVRDNPASWRTADALTALGDLLASAGRYDQAVQAYGRLARDGSSEIKRRAAVLAAEALAGKGDHDRAIELFDRVAQSDDAADPLARRALAGKAQALAAAGEPEAALELGRRLVRNAQPADAAARAAGYNTLGRVYEATDRTTDAVLAYLHTDLLFADDPDTHAEALARLAELFGKIGKPDAADDARERLRRGYASTRWARRAVRPN